MGILTGAKAWSQALSHFLPDTFPISDGELWRLGQHSSGQRPEPCSLAGTGQSVLCDWLLFLQILLSFEVRTMTHPSCPQHSHCDGHFEFCMHVGMPINWLLNIPIRKCALTDDKKGDKKRHTLREVKITSCGKSCGTHRRVEMNFLI